MQITNNSSGSGVKVNLIKGVSSEAITEALIRINEQELNIIGYESQTKTYRDETSVLRDNTQVSANNANVSATNANNSALLSTAKANEAILSANNALTYRNEAETFKTNAKASEINADLRATAASTSELNAKSSELLALQYKDTTLSLKNETLLLKNETVLNAITATEQATISTSNAIIAEQQAQIATTKASESLVNANNAKASELLSAQYKADNESIKINVQTLSNSAYDSANTASIKANEAIDSAIISTTQANISIAKASEASTYATNSNTSAVNALASENKAEEWANKEYGLEVEPGLYSSKHYATESNNALISMHSSVNSLANTVVKRDNNSDILTRTLNTTIESTSDIATKYYVETNNDGYLRPKVLSDVRTEIAGDKVTKTGNETIDGVKTFSLSPIVPTPTAGTQVTNKAYVDGKYSGFKNYIINGKKQINQRVLTSKDNSYNQDRWYKAGNNWFQGIEGGNNLISGKKYTLSWIGAATASYYVGTATSTTINAQSFTAITNGENFTLTISAGQNLWIKFASDATGSTFNFVQLEEGLVATPFENRPFGLELSLCQRYYEEMRNPWTEGRYHTQSFKVTKRTTPTISVESGNISNQGNTTQGICIYANGGISNPTYSVYVDAEL